MTLRSNEHSTIKISTMSPYTEDCISLACVFGDPIGYPMYTQPTLRPLLIHEAATGTRPEETAQKLFEPGNYLYLQRDFAPKLSEQLFAKGMALVPPDDITQCITDVYSHNASCPKEERVSLKIRACDSLEYTFRVSGSFFGVTPIVYLRNPVTGIVTRHQYPYSAMPPIRLRTADPLLVALRARTLLGGRGKSASGPALYALSRATGHYSTKIPIVRHPPFPIPPLLLVPCDPLLPSTPLRQDPAHSGKLSTRDAEARLPPSRKRQRSALAAGADKPSSKRSRTMRPCIPIRRNPPRAAKSASTRVPPTRRLQ
ncbi:hypothetical protein CYLTODRAFT_493493, partial [Cylindrobasidium torrendii FP15055 ss-10]